MITDKKSEKASFNVDPEVLKRFKVLVAAKHGTLWRVCGEEVTKALEERAEKLEEELGISFTDVGVHAKKASGRKLTRP